MIKAIPLRKAKEIMEKPNKNLGLYWTHDDTYIPNQYIAIVNTRQKHDHQSFESKNDAIKYLLSNKN